MFLNSLDVCPFIVTNIIAKHHSLKIRNFSQKTFRENHALTGQHLCRPRSGSVIIQLKTELDVSNN